MCSLYALFWIPLNRLPAVRPSSQQYRNVQSRCLSSFYKLIGKRKTLNYLTTSLFLTKLFSYRYHVPSLPSSRLPDSTRDGLMASLKPCLQVVLRTALAQEEFTKECLEKRLQSREEAFALTLVLCTATTGIVSYASPGKTPWWMLLDPCGHFLLMKQYLSCIGLLQQEICTPVYLKMSEEEKM